MRIGKIGTAALVAGGIAAVLVGDAVARKSTGDPFEEHATKDGFTPSAKRISRRQSVDRENMQAVYDAKPTSYRVAKRVFDVTLSSIALIGLSPLFAATAIAIVVEDGFPVIYRSQRPGKDMKPFEMLKFRSMRKDADRMLANLMVNNEQTGAAFKMKEDPRVTKVGRFIRKYSIDELPQLINVLKGDCSIVGPRAIVPTKKYSQHEMQRQIVQPGLTCYWQVLGRANIPWGEWVELDLDYIQDMSLATDTRLIVRTIPVVFSGDGGF